MCKGRVLHGCAFFRCLSTWTSRTCHWSLHPLVCNPFSPQDRASLQKRASVHEPAPSDFFNGANQIENCHAQRYSALLAAAHADEEGVEAVGLAVLAVPGPHLEHSPSWLLTWLVAGKYLQHLQVEGCPSKTVPTQGPTIRF